MPRYELSDGSSSKFWDIQLSGKTFTVTFGKIGANGQTQLKTFKTDAEARTAHDKLVAEKTKKGYVLVGGTAAQTGKTGKTGKAGKTGKTSKASKTGKAAKAEPEATNGGGKLDARNPELEKAIVANPFDREAYAVFGDWLQEQGDPRGELIALQLGNKDVAAKKLIEQHQDYFLGPLAEHVKTRDGLGNNSISHLRTPEQEKAWQKTGEEAFLWRHGFIYRVRLSHDSYYDEEWEGECSAVLEQVLAHPSGRYVVELSFQSNGDPNENDLQSLIDVLANKAPPTTRKITFGDNVDQISWHHTGYLGKLWKAVPNLTTIEIETGEFEVGPMDAPALERAVFITGGLSKSCGKNIAKAKLPNIKHLEIYYGTERYGGGCAITEVRPLLDRTDLPKLEYLGIKNSELADEIAAAIGNAKILKGVKTLDLSLGTMTDEGAKSLAAAKSSLQHLEVLDLHRNYLSKDGIKLVKDLAKKVITDDQQKPSDWGGELHYYTAIAE